MLRDPVIEGLPEGVVLDERLEQNLAHDDIYYVVLPDGTRTAWKLYRTDLECVICHNDPKRRQSCKECHGVGFVNGVPWCERPWDQVIPLLYLGGHHTQTDDAVVDREFDLVVSLFRMPGYGPGPGVREIIYRMADADLDPERHTELDEIAEEVEYQVAFGRKVLVRCQAGMNRSGLVTGLAMLKMGWTVDDILARMRQARSPYVLFNKSFVDYLREVEGRR